MPTTTEEIKISATLLTKRNLLSSLQVQSQAHTVFSKIHSEKDLKELLH